jgi:hypothetical protein
MEELNKLKPLQKAREAHQANPIFRNNMFEVVFTKLPGATDEERESLRYMVAGTKIPGAGDTFHFGSDKGYNWNVMIIANVQHHLLFTQWYNTRRSETADADLILYSELGETIATYRVKNLEIKEVADLNLMWDQIATLEYFQVSFTTSTLCEVVI